MCPLRVHEGRTCPPPTPTQDSDVCVGFLRRIRVELAHIASLIGKWHIGQRHPQFVVSEIHQLEPAVLQSCGDTGGDGEDSECRHTHTHTHVRGEAAEWREWKKGRRQTEQRPGENEKEASSASRRRRLHHLSHHHLLRTTDDPPTLPPPSFLFAFSPNWVKEKRVSKWFIQVDL